MENVIYKIVNIENGKSYIGGTADSERRWRIHLYQLSAGTHHNVLLQKDYNELGPEAFKFEIVEVCTRDNLWDRENYYLETMWDELYNIGRTSVGGDNVTAHPNRDAICRKHATNYRHIKEKSGGTHPAQAVDRTGDKNPNWRGGVSNPPCVSCGKPKPTPNGDRCKACYTKIGEQNPFYGKSHSDETKALIKAGQERKLAERRKKRIPTSCAKCPVIDGVKYLSLMEASKALGIPFVTIGHRCRNKSPKFDNYQYSENA